MKASELKKNSKTTVRFNEEVRELLKAKGLSIQTVLDKAINAELGEILFASSKDFGEITAAVKGRKVKIKTKE